MSALLRLAERCERSAGPDRCLDWMIQLRDGLDGIGAYGPHPHYTASIDAAMTLVPDEMKFTLDTHYMLATIYEYWSPSSPQDDGWQTHRGEAATLALALCAAVLRARAASVDTHPKGGDEGNTSAPFMSGAVPPGEAGDAQTPPSESPS